MNVLWDYSIRLMTMCNSLTLPYKKKITSISDIHLYLHLNSANANNSITKKYFRYYCLIIGLVFKFLFRCTNPTQPVSYTPSKHALCLRKWTTPPLPRQHECTEALVNSVNASPAVPTKISRKFPKMCCVKVCFSDLTYCLFISFFVKVEAMCLHFLSSIILHWCHFVKDATFVQAFCVNFSCAQINTWCLNPGTIEMFAFIFCIYFSSILCNVQTCLKNKTVVS